ncbi:MULTISPECIES: Sec-independent protein translocase protein TatB [unclassified Novosphingobium]|uniref:Sec-independent protein translocase protein TatB n=1 Tax=unclassified Novosphingobium TaxID=2644732 RepID=UPI0025EAE45E|nr:MULTISPECIES: Sec-independent protein translocase protein TatB [unclassified Novosphingobium]HQV03400.1 Sec-independent protein translocase protein TatB [Novosphingobium sp.]
MFDIGWDEMLLTAIVAIVVIGPKELPRALRTAGQWIGKVRRISGHFRSGVENMIREAELQEMENKWREQNEAIMASHPPTASAEAALVGEDPGTMPSPPAQSSVKAPPVTEKPKRTAKPRKKAG